MTGISDARRVVEHAIGTRVFPAAAIDVGSADASLWTDQLGTLTFDEGSAAAGPDTPFDLASLTKVIATTTVAMDLVAAGALTLDDHAASYFPEWRGKGRETTTVADLLEHTSGLPARLLDAPPEGRREFEHEICSIRLEYEPRTRSMYSDLDFILLGFLLTDAGKAPLDAQFARAARMLRAEPLAFGVGRSERHRAAPTLPLPEDPRRGRVLAGEVHDNYAAALGGVAGHAGLFGTASAVGAFARGILGAWKSAGPSSARWPRPIIARFAERSRVPASSRALGWDTMLPTSSCGSKMSASAIGHTGFTGTSLWIDPDRDRYFVLLTNRVCGGGTLEQMREVRRAFHDALSAI